jgi:hypothetical protein
MPLEDGYRECNAQLRNGVSIKKAMLRVVFLGAFGSQGSAAVPLCLKCMQCRAGPGMSALRLCGYLHGVAASDPGGLHPISYGAGVGLQGVVWGGVFCKEARRVRPLLRAAAGAGASGRS